MGAKSYKYASAQVLSKVFEKPGSCTLKCSYPKDFNDPYELFLTIDFRRNSEELAYYLETIGEIPQIPTTCFSRAPDIVPMWAHYANNHEGFVLEFDEECLVEHFPKLVFEDVDYEDGATSRLESFLQHAYVQCKPRHVFWLQRAVFSAAYYTKMTCWSYEKERRLLARDEYVQARNGILLLSTPVRCITAIIAGARASSETISLLRTLSEEIGSQLYQMRIGRSSPKPYFVDSDRVTWEFANGEVTRIEYNCRECNEPIQLGDVCSWCSISEDDLSNAAMRNPIRLLDNYGLLDKYYASVRQVDQREGSDGKRKK